MVRSGRSFHFLEGVYEPTRTSKLERLQLNLDFVAVRSCGGGFVRGRRHCWPGEWLNPRYRYRTWQWWRAVLRACAIQCTSSHVFSKTKDGLLHRLKSRTNCKPRGVTGE